MAHKRAEIAVDQPPVSTRLRGPWLFAARLAWVLITLLSVGKAAIGMPLFLTEKAQVCTASPEICSQGGSFSVSQLRALELAGVSLPEFVNALAAFKTLNILIWFGTGVLIFLLRSDDWLALLASAMMTLSISTSYQDLIAAAYPRLGFLAGSIFNLANILLFLFIGLFPGGRFSPRWMRWYWLGMIAITNLPLEVIVSKIQISNSVLFFYWISFLVLGPFSQVYRYRNSSTPLERQQTKWVVLGFVSFAGLFLGIVAIKGLFPSELGQIVNDNFFFDIASWLIPLSVGISVLRYRLWDIDVIIRKTLVYSVVTGLLALVYFGGTVLLQGLFSRVAGGSSSPLVTVISTLGIVVLFSPLRRRVQAGVDRRFYRQKYDAGQTLAAFAAQARDEVELKKLTDHLLAVVQETVQPQSISLWMREPEIERSEHG